MKVSLTVNITPKLEANVLSMIDEFVASLPSRIKCEASYEAEEKSERKVPQVAGSSGKDGKGQVKRGKKS